jgi:hypothetical protein
MRLFILRHQHDANHCLREETDKMPEAIPAVNPSNPVPLRRFGLWSALVGIVWLLGMAGSTLAQEVRKPRALVYGETESPLLEPLRRAVKLIPYNGNLEELGTAQMLILDGKRFSPEMLQRDELVRAAVYSGLWVLALDVTETHKQMGLASALSVATDGASLAYLLHMGRDENNGPQVDIAEVPSLEELGRRELDSHTASTIVGALLDHMTRPRLGLTGSTTPPPGLLYVTYNFTQIYPEGELYPYIYQNVLSPVTPEPSNVPQSPSLQANETLTVMLDNKDNPQGNFQYVVAETDITAVPKLPSESFANYQNSFWSAEGDYLELGWFQTRANTSISAPSDPNGWITSGTSPETVNGQNSITSGVTFQVGYTEGQGGSGSFQYSSSTTRTITDWKVTNDSAETQAVWQYRTAYPVDADQPDYYCREQTNLYSQYSCFPERLPNDLSINTLQLHTSAVWRTMSVVNKTVPITVQNLHEMVLLYCPQDELEYTFLTCESPAQHVDSFNHRPKQLLIDLGAVIPVPIHSLTFNPNPATAGTQVTGTVQLKSPALIDTGILLSSNSQNATVLPSVIIKRGQTSATFQVLTNSNGLGNCGSTTATIDAFYAQDFQAQLQVKNACNSVTDAKAPVR